MTLAIYRKCCGHGGKEIRHVKEWLDALKEKQGVTVDIFTTQKNGLVGQKRLTKEQQDDQHVYLEWDGVLVSFEEWVRVRDLLNG